MGNDSPAFDLTVFNIPKAGRWDEQTKHKWSSSKYLWAKQRNGNVGLGPVSICHFVRRNVSLYLICHSGLSPATLLLRNQPAHWDSIRTLCTMHCTLTLEVP